MDLERVTLTIQPHPIVTIFFPLFSYFILLLRSDLWSNLREYLRLTDRSFIDYTVSIIEVDPH